MIPLFKVNMPQSVLKPMSETLLSGFIGQGPRVDEFENALVPWMGGPNILALNSGTSAIHLALRLAGVAPGDEVITTAMTCTATNEPILERGADIVWADINPKTGNIDPTDVKKKVTARTKAIISVHWAGYPCDLDELNAIAKEHGIKHIEDAAHAFGAQYKGSPVGAHSDFTCFSFQAIKHLTTVDGGALVCADPGDYKRGKLLRWYGIDRESNRKDFRCEEDISEYGYKFHMNDVAASIGLEQLKHIDGILKRHRENAAYYEERFKGAPGVELLSYSRDRSSSYWLFTLLVNNRVPFMKQMQQEGIMVSQVHARNDRHSMFGRFSTPLPGVDRFVERQVSVPVGWWLGDKDREQVADAITRFCG